MITATGPCMAPALMSAASVGSQHCTITHADRAVLSRALSIKKTDNVKESQPCG